MIRRAIDEITGRQGSSTEAHYSSRSVPVAQPHVNGVVDFQDEDEEGLHL